MKDEIGSWLWLDLDLDFCKTLHWFKCITWTFFVKWTLEIYPGLQQKILSGLRRKSNPMTLMMSSLKATFPPTFCTGRRYYSQVWWRQFPYSDPNLNSQIRFCKTNNIQKNFRIHEKFFHFNFEGVKLQLLKGLFIFGTLYNRFASSGTLCTAIYHFTPFACLHSVLHKIYKSSKQKIIYLVQGVSLPRGRFY